MNKKNVKILSTCHRFTATIDRMSFTVMKERRHFYDSIQNKIFICITSVVSILVILTTLLIYANSSNVIKQSAMTFMSTTLHTVNRQIQDLHTRTVNILLKIAINSTVRTIIPLNPDLASYEEFEQYREIDNLIRNYIAEESYIERIVIIRSDGRVFFSGSPIMMREEALELYNTCLQYEGDTFFTVSGNMYFYRPIYTSDDGQGAIVLADLNEETIDSIFQRSSFTNMDIFIMTQNGRLFSQTPSNTINIENVNKVLSTPLQHRNSDPQEIRIEKEKYLSTMETIPDTGLTSVCFVSYLNLFSDSFKILYIAIALIILSIGISILISYFLSRLITKDLRSLRISMLKISQGKIKERTKIPKAAEIKDLAVIFNNMMDKMDELIRETAKKEIDKQKLEQDYLTMQIQPHFIYNTLNLIKIMALKNHENEMADAVTALVELLRAVTGKTERYTSLENEVNYARQYVCLHDFRNECSISLDVDMEKGIEETRVPTLILQPLVENACLHGFEGCKCGIISIRAFRKEGKVNIQVKDDGCGFETDASRNGRLYGIGISNVIERMQLLYGQSFTFNIQSSRNKGTVVELIF